jgi:hypothetical protein
LQDALLAQVRDLTSAHGSRKLLAEHLGIPLPRLSEYLANPPVRRPNGETTLALQAWAARTKKNLPKV